MSKQLYRITSLEGFLSLLVNKNERFVHPIECWEDTYEGYMLHRLDSDEGTKEVLKKLYEEITPNNVSLTIRNYIKLLRARYECYGQCWSLDADSDAMWRIYSYGKKSIQLISNGDLIKKTIKESVNEDNVTIRIAPVKYDISTDTSDLSQVLFNQSKTNEPYYHKREAFKHENEVRVIISRKDLFKEYTDFSEQALLVNYKKLQDEKLSPVENIMQISKDYDKRGDYYRSRFPNAIYVGIKDITRYIIGVKVHPQAEDWYVELIRNICQQYAIPFRGKSTLYESIV